MPGAKKLIVIVLEEIDKTNSQTLDKQSPSTPWEYFYYHCKDVTIQKTD